MSEEKGNEARWDEQTAMDASAAGENGPATAANDAAVSLRIDGENGDPESLELKDHQNANGAQNGNGNPALSPPPDGGYYGFVIVVACFFTQAFTFGYQTSFGPFQRYFVASQTFGPQTTNVQIAFIASLNSAVTFIVGPLTGRMIETFGFRVTAITGSLLLCLGMQLSSLATAFWHLYLSYGVIGGIGIALAYIPSTSVLPQYFTKRLGLAMVCFNATCGFDL